MDLEERVKIMKENRGCWSCLRIGHRAVDFKFRQKYVLDDCDNYHHQTLHEIHVSDIIFHNDFKNENHSSETCL